MLTFKISDDKLYLILVKYDLKQELSALRFYFKKHRKGYFHDTMYKRKLWDGYDHFVNFDETIQCYKLGLGLWKELINFKNTSGCEITIDGLDSLFNLDYTIDQITKFSSVMLDGTGITARDYQIEAVYRGLKYKRCSLELATSAGKTIVFYLYLAFLKRKGLLSSDGKKALIVVPKKSLVSQTYDKFAIDYDTKLISFNLMQIGGSHKFKKDLFDKSEIVISTYQSLNNLDTELFKQFNIICIDEAHTSRGDSIKNILLNSTNADYKIGLSGTIEVDSQYSDFFKIQEHLGPLGMKLSAEYLIENKYSPDVYIRMIYLKYPISNPFVQKYMEFRQNGGSTDLVKGKVDGKKLYEAERQFIIGYEPRLEFISRFVKKLPGNSMVLYIDVKNAYGKRIQSKILDWNEYAYYIDGEVSVEFREDYQRIMENSNKSTILTFDDKIIKINQYSKVPLSNGIVKFAKDLTIEDEILDSWIDLQKSYNN